LNENKIQLLLEVRLTIRINVKVKRFDIGEETRDSVMTIY
jgi:hypothetical protein